MKTVSAADANRHFSKIMRDVEQGETYIVTSRGRPRIRMEAIKEDGQAERDEAARQQEWIDFLAELARKPPLNLGPIRRDELYDD